MAKKKSKKKVTKTKAKKIVKKKEPETCFDCSEKLINCECMECDNCGDTVSLVYSGLCESCSDENSLDNEEKNNQKLHGDSISNLCCSFCGKSQREVKKLIAGPGVYMCNECVDTSVEIIAEENFDKKDVIKKSAECDTDTPQGIKEYLDKHVIGQEGAKKILSVATYAHAKRINNPKLKLEKSNIILSGPTGTGKTYMVKTLAKLLDVPFAIADATTLTESGYVGSDVDTILQALLANAGGDTDLAENGIIFIDEIDKIASKGESASVTNSGVGSTGVQQALLKLVEGGDVEVGSGKRRNPGESTNKLNTDNILFIVGGAFNGLESMTAEGLIKFGLIPEFVGRFPVITKLEPLSLSDLKRVLTEPKNSLITQYQNLMGTDSIDLEFTPEALDLIAERALERKIGARALRSVVEDAMLEVQYQGPSNKNSKVIISPEVMTGMRALEFISNPKAKEENVKKRRTKTKGKNKSKNTEEVKECEAVNE